MAAHIYYTSIPFVRSTDGRLASVGAAEMTSYRAATIQARATVGTLIGSDMVVGAVAVSRVRDVELADELTLVLTRFGETPVLLIG